jgi:glycosyltransferase involved in cell wall biosynthesis
MDAIKDNPKVTVIIPTHNHAHFLPECLASVRGQTYSDYEVIVINNGSTDNTEEVVRKLSWNKLRHHYQNDTGSVAGPRNTGIRLAKGDYVAFLDSDDLWYRNKLEQVMKVLISDKSIDIISHDLYMTRQGKEKKLVRCGPLKENMVKSLLLNNCLLGSATVVKTNTMREVGGFDDSKDFVHVEDCEAWIRIAYLGRKFFFLNEVLGEYRVHSANLSNDFECVLKNAKNIIDKHYKKVKSRMPFYSYFLYLYRLSNINFRLSVQYFFKKRYLKSLAKLLQSLFLNPLALPFNIETFIKSI